MVKGPLTLNGIGFLSPKIYCYYKWQKWFLWAVTAAQTVENHRDEWDLNWYLQLRIFTSIPTWTTHTKFSSSSRRTKFKAILLWNLNQMITKTVAISTRIVISCTMKRGIPFWVWREFNGDWDNDMITISQRTL